MKPNWFIAFTTEIRGLTLPLAPAGLRVFCPEDRHLTVAFLGSVPGEMASDCWAQAERLDWREAQGGFSGIRLLGASAISAIVKADVFDVALMMNQRHSLLEAAGLTPSRQEILPHITLARQPRKPLLAARERTTQWLDAIQFDHARFQTTGLGLFTWADDRRLRQFKIVRRIVF